MADNDFIADKPKVMFLNCLFYGTSSPKPENISYMIQRSSKSPYLRSWNQQLFGILA